ncbi:MULTISPECIES: protein-glutamate methylesterase/protein-glutamine glutaminase [Halocynthiibacter]|uniref:Protein-glutamate methylesterase/protein-glutamine glutaminase n=1 Tax=Halocynthiibacter halioticoli TaxID=2986804 RepID=A0AAE3LT23_9RHOB|nr:MULTISPECIES: chemotaxis response regulator protein-glutamate methylesterase [Halocynthiibacter]MCV6824366.1 chemotaxis response regulator protein-glutamate methylesterase [Halocynthiibacter halioticoli]MCW4057367.1 chemotaxis response regulator protein-glutamate methylesterase [Halocynthiibacter sp. SDUM655004]
MNKPYQSDRYRVLIVDDSVVVRMVLSKLLSADPMLEVVGAAKDAREARDLVRRLNPDVITLDVEMPEIDGLSFLRVLMKHHPLPVVMCSSLVGRGSDILIQALEAGALDAIEKPKMGAKEFFLEAQTQICDTVRGAAMARIPVAGKRQERRRRPRDVEYAAPSPGNKLTADAVLPPRPLISSQTAKHPKIIAIGASTGGPEALRKFLETMPENTPPIVVVQHMPEAFTGAFANRLNKYCKVEVVEAQHGMALTSGTAFIAPGGKHLAVKRSENVNRLQLLDGPLVARHRPSADVLFRSVAQQYGASSCGVLLTGMGDDGAQGLCELRQTGAVTYGQSEESCVVYGMPKVAKQLGGVAHELPLMEIPAAIQDVLNS